MQGDCECCAVCIEPYKLSETLRILPCGQESILQVDGDTGGQDSLGSQGTSPRHLGGISPLPEIRAVILTDQQRQRFFDNSADDDSSRASTPDEMTPSLPQRGQFPVRQELCVSCIAAKAAAVINQINNDKDMASTSTDSDIQQVLSLNSDSGNKVQNSTKRSN
ncbi:hypothetical protein NQ314_010783 [Rhamnusium bicolor]|uniref:Uncharacterized protein n=1 Tax=Rhamnusium bicolor TaxID=1586634 RepID=A0AAV8XMS1_9CUCU|nr:hypothetical protein NQ314_010783 [Rhamnusium bicolor]